jgi:uncharacterized protein (DUF1330 family)
MIVLAKITDREAFIEGYGKPAGSLVAKFGGRYVLRGPGISLLEGDWGEGASAVISEWPDLAAIHAFWGSPEYAEVKKGREGVADCRVWAIEAPKIT